MTLLKGYVSVKILSCLDPDPNLKPSVLDNTPKTVFHGESLLVQVFPVTNLVLLLLLLAYIPQVGIVFHNVLAHLIHSVHQQLQTLPQVITEIQKTFLKDWIYYKYIYITWKFKLFDKLFCTNGRACTCIYLFSSWLFLFMHVFGDILPGFSSYSVLPHYKYDI